MNSLVSHLLVFINYSLIHLYFDSALQLLETLSPWRHIADDALATQIDVFEESNSDDNAHLNMPGGVDINSHEDMYNAVFAKVSVVFECTVSCSL